MPAVLSRADLDFLLFRWLRVGDLTAHPAFGGQSEADYAACLDLAFRLAEEAFLPAWKPSDRDEPAFGPDGRVRVEPGTKAAVQAWLGAGLQLASVPEDLGGMGLPMVIATAAMAPVMAAHVGASGFAMLSMANARLIREAGTPEQIAEFAVPQHEGRALGTMCLSEPDAGSSLGDITTRAVAEGDGWRLTGRKMWISAADHDVTDQIVHLVLAKIALPDGSLPVGTAGISLFIVPRLLADGRPNDVTIAGLNHKMGYRGTPNCVVHLGEGGGAQGWLLGQPGQGLALMFRMMNEARINVGLSGAALAGRAWLLARDYARERAQGRPMTDKRAARPVPIDRHPDVRRMLLQTRAIAEGSLALCLYSARLVDRAGQGDERAQALLDLLTPITKSWPSEMGLVACHNAIQIHGGYGYTRDFDVEQLYRDSRLNPIHEGTTGIQGLDLTGRKLMGDRLRGWDILREEMVATVTLATVTRAAAVPDVAAMAATLTGEIARLDTLLRAGLVRPLPEMLAQGTPILSGMGHLVSGWLWLDIALAALEPGVPAEQRDGRLWTARYVHVCEMPMIAALVAPLAAGSTLTLDLPTDAL